MMVILSNLPLIIVGAFIAFAGVLIIDETIRNAKKIEKKIIEPPHH
jgi:hypothetical protein